MIAHTCPQQASPLMPQLLQALHPLFRPEEEPGARDNAAGAVGRTLLAMGAALPVEQIVPVLVSALPLQVRAARAARGATWRDEGGRGRETSAGAP
jgi:hypothetical protein